MRLAVAKEPLRRILRWTQRALFACGVLTLGYCGFVVVDGWMYQNRERSHFEELLHDRQAASAGALQIASPTSAKSQPATVINGLIGRLEIPRLGVSAMVIEGIGSKTLRRAVGHIPGTPLPGQPGNVGISGHRDTFFRPLRNVRQDDVITLATLAGEYRYRVASTKIVKPRDVAVLDSSESEILTLVTCYPFYFVGPAPYRFIVRAERVN